MSQANVEITQESFAHFVATGEPAWATLDEEVEVHDHDLQLDASDYRGHAGYRRWIENWAAVMSEFNIEAEEWIDAGERVVVFLRMRATGRGSGVTLDRQDAMVAEVRDRKIVRVDYYNSRREALRAVGLEE
jgi:ketosteroid isomerase-like protein